MFTAGATATGNTTKGTVRPSRIYPVREECVFTFTRRIYRTLFANGIHTGGGSKFKTRGGVSGDRRRAQHSMDKTAIAAAVATEIERQQVRTALQWVWG